MLFRLTTCNLYVAIQKGLFAFFSFTTKNFYTTPPCTQFVQPLGVFCQFGKIAMQMHKNFLCDVCRVREKNHKFLHNAAVYAICATVWCFLSIWQNCNADAQKLSLRCLPCKREKPQISAQRRRVRNLCNRLVFFVNLAKLQCRCTKTFFAMFAVQ